MKYSITFLEKDYLELTSHLFQNKTEEHAAYLLCTLSKTDVEKKLIVKDIIVVAKEEVLFANETQIRIKPISYIRALKRARLENKCFVLVHSHPKGNIKHSQQDDIQEKMLFSTAFTTIEHAEIHASLVLSDPNMPVGRVWNSDLSYSDMSVVRILGDRLRYIYNPTISESELPQFFDRQVRAFGEDIQRILKQMTIGVVGCGGTGSSVVEQLIRLGVGTLYVFDEQTFEKSNVNRVYGSKSTDEGAPKVVLLKTLAEGIEVDTEVIPNQKHIYQLSAAEKLKNCDAVFGCTDDHLGRSILCKLATYYCIPVFDMGVSIDSEEQIIKSVQGRVTYLFPHNACLICRNRINPKMIQAESLTLTNPEAVVQLVKEGYIPELPGTTPSVITFTTSVASSAINEFLHRLTGFMGEGRVSNEILHLFDQTLIRRNHRLSDEGCFCGDPNKIGRGDRRLFLDLTWMPEK